MNNFYIISNQNKDPDGTFSRQITDYLNNKNVNLYTENDHCDLNSVDYVIVLGGDGTLLKAVRDFNGENASFLGINSATFGQYATITDNTALVFEIYNRTHNIPSGTVIRIIGF